MQELLLGEQSPSPSLSRSSSVSSVLMVSIFRLSLSSSIPLPSVPIDHHYLCNCSLLPRCHHHPRHHLCQLCHPHNLSWTEAPTTPPVKMCSRWKQCCFDWQESYSRWTTLDIWERFLTDFCKILSFPLQQMSREEGEDPATSQRDTSPEFVSLEEDTTGERREGKLERENFRLKEQVLLWLTADNVFRHTWHWKEGIDFKTWNL